MGNQNNLSSSEPKGSLVVFCKAYIIDSFTYWAYQSGLLLKAIHSLFTLSMQSICVSFMALGTTLICGVWRWKWILKSLNLPPANICIGLQLYYEGLFYNTFAQERLQGCFTSSLASSESSRRF